MFVRLEIELVDPEQDGAADDQRKAHHPRIEQECLDVASGDRTDHGRGQERDQHADHEAARGGIREHAERDPPQFGKIQRHDRENRAELNQDRETLPERTLAEIEEAFGQQQMARRGYRDEFRDALDDAENHRPHCIRHHAIVPL